MFTTKNEIKMKTIYSLFAKLLFFVAIPLIIVYTIHRIAKDVVWNDNGHIDKVLKRD